jgi:chromosome segregation ATPase
MRTIIALCFAFLAVSAFAKKHHDSKLGQGFKLLAQFATADEAEDVLDVLENVQGEIQTIIDQTQANYDAKEAASQEAFAGYQANIDDLTSQIEALQETIDNDNSIAQTLQDQIDGELSTIQQSSQSLGDEQARRADAHAAFAANYDSIQSAIDAGQEAINLLKIMEENDQTTTMLEISHKKLHKAFKHIHHTIDTLALKNTFTSMAGVLLEVAQNGVNTDIVGQLNDLITALIATLQDELDVAVQNENDDIAYSTQTCDNLQATIDGATESANANQEQLDATNEDLSNSTTAQENLQATLDSVTEARDNLVASWTQTAKDYDNLLARLHADIDALQEAQTFLA